MKVYDNEILKSKYSGFNNLREGRFAYPTPEYCEMCSKNIYSPEELDRLKHKSDIFMLGLVLLELCIVENSETLYDISNFNFDYNKLEERINMAA